MEELKFLDDYFPQSIIEYLKKYNQISEIRLKKHKPLSLVNDNTVIVEDSIIITKELFEGIFNSFCDYSIYSHNETIKQCYITLKNGARVGICGTAIYDNNGLASINEITSLVIRIPREITDCSREVINAISPGSTVIIGKPSSGKTTLLRDMTRLLSDEHKKRIVLIDERNEIAGKYKDRFLLNVGVNTDVITGMKKEKAIEIAIRTLSPEIIVCDEITTMEEFKKIQFGFSCGVDFLLSHHSDSLEQFNNKQIGKALLKENIKNLLLLKENYKAEIIDLEKKNEVYRNDYDNNILNPNWFKSFKTN